LATRQQIIALTQQGASAQEIADQLGCSRRTVMRWR
jgi:DNA-binding CsgD family transcriptional regulator